MMDEQTQIEIDAKIEELKRLPGVVRATYQGWILFPGALQPEYNLLVYVEREHDLQMIRETLRHSQLVFGAEIVQMGSSAGMW